MGSIEIINRKPIVEDDDRDQTGHVIDFSYFHSERDELKRKMNEMSAGNLPKDGSESMKGNIDMNNHNIFNLSVDTNDISSVANINYVNFAKAELTKELTDSFNKKICESHVSVAADKKHVFTYVMVDVNKSTSVTDNIIVDSIKDYLIHLIL